MEYLKTMVIDNGTGFTKMGYAGNSEPTHKFPTCIAALPEKVTQSANKKTNEQLDFYIGNEALLHTNTHQPIWPIREGIISNWELMEKFWHKSIFEFLRGEPEEHNFILTEPPMNPPENREKLAEIFFETFNAKGLYIGVQAVLALYSDSRSQQLSEKDSLTGTVLDAGDGVTHIIPVVDGHVIGSCIKHIPLAGRDMTQFLMRLLKDRNEPIPSKDIYQISQQIKEKFCYLSKSGDLVKEFQKFDQEPKRFKQFHGVNSFNSEKYTVDIGYEQFLVPEMFFRPEFVDNKWRNPIDEVIDNAIQSCPIDSRKRLYQNIVLSGGSTLTRYFNERLQNSIQARIDARLEKFQEAYKSNTNFKIECRVSDNPFKQFSVWQGGSLMAAQPGFERMTHTKQQYEEYGPSIARHNAVFIKGM